MGCVWDGFSNSLFGELGWRRKHPPLLSRLPILRIARSLRPLPPCPPSPRRPYSAGPPRPGRAFPPAPQAAWRSDLSCPIPRLCPVVIHLTPPRPYIPARHQPQLPHNCPATGHLSVFISSCNSTRHETTAFTL